MVIWLVPDPVTWALVTSIVSTTLSSLVFLIVMDPVWNYAGILQIRGRAVRFMSHENLPRKERHVDIYYMMLETSRKECKSGDTVVYDIVKQKRN